MLKRSLLHALLVLGLTSLVLFGSSCSGEDDTHLVVVMDTDYDVPTEVDRIRVRVLKVAEDGAKEAQTWSREFMLTTEQTTASELVALPASFSVVPTAPDIDREVVVELEGLLEDRLMVARRARTGFVRGEFRVLRMFLYRACADTSCPEGASCGCLRGSACSPPSCVDERVDPAELETTNDPGALPPQSNIPSGCGSGQSLCGSTCADLATDPRFCGDCDTTCGAGELCTEGECIDPDDCRNDESRCNGFTYCNRSTGECERGCDGDEQCGRAERCDLETHACVCQASLVRCPPAFGDCVDVSTDLVYCGDCNTACPANHVCSEGICMDLGDCRTNGLGCTGFSYCDERTGSCIRGCLLDEQCAGSNELCDTESHDCVCGDGFERCPTTGGDCVDTQTDLTYCGDCETSCVDGDVCDEGICVDPTDCRTNQTGCTAVSYCDQETGQCLPGCDRQEQCPDANDRCDLSTHSCVCKDGFTRCGVQCVDLDDDPRFCGGCANACEGTETCQQGSCINPNDCRTNGIGCIGFTYCNDDTGACLSGCVADTQCATTEECNVGTHECVCSSGLTRCAGECVDTLFDDNNCGRCNERCRGNRTCVLGLCLRPGEED